MKYLTVQITGKIADKFQKEKKEFEDKIGCRITWTQFFSQREINNR